VVIKVWKKLSSVQLQAQWLWVSGPFRVFGQNYFNIVEKKIIFAKPDPMGRIGVHPFRIFFKKNITAERSKLLDFLALYK
jgi:hypothetical protein